MKLIALASLLDPHTYKWTLAMHARRARSREMAAHRL